MSPTLRQICRQLLAEFARLLGELPSVSEQKAKRPEKAVVGKNVEDHGTATTRIIQ